MSRGRRTRRTLLGARATRSGSLIYKILLPDEWETFDSSDRFDGSPLDAESGFVHCSSRSQIAATAERFFFGEPSIVVVAVDTASIAETLRWEPAPNGDLFPHVYGPLPRDSVVAVYRVAGAAELDGAIEGGRAGTAGDRSR